MLYAYPGLSDKQSGSFLTGCLFGIHMRRRLSWSHSWGALSSTQMWTQDMLHKYTEHYIEGYSQVRKCHKQKEFSFSCASLRPIVVVVNLWYTSYMVFFLQPVYKPSTTGLQPMYNCVHHLCDLVNTPFPHLITRVHSSRLGALTARNRWSCKKNVSAIPHICHFFYTGKIFAE